MTLGYFGIDGRKSFEPCYQSQTHRCRQTSSKSVLCFVRPQVSLLYSELPCGGSKPMELRCTWIDFLSKVSRKELGCISRQSRHRLNYGMFPLFSNWHLEFFVHTYLQNGIHSLDVVPLLPTAFAVFLTLYQPRSSRHPSLEQGSSSTRFGAACTIATVSPSRFPICFGCSSRRLFKSQTPQTNLNLSQSVWRE
jgi:hypothetical protein